MPTTPSIRRRRDRRSGPRQRLPEQDDAPRTPASCNVRRVAVRHLVGVPLRCLIVDDHLDVLRAMRGLLERDGIQVVAVASNSADAIAAAAETQPDVALLDIDLGEESGFDLAERLDTPRVIMVSTHTAADYADLIAASPAIGFLDKSTLTAGAVRELLKRPRERG
jgi:CheY-like chemotaxis protein